MPKLYFCCVQFCHAFVIITSILQFTAVQLNQTCSVKNIYIYQDDNDSSLGLNLNTTYEE